MTFLKKILKISNDDTLRKKIAKNGKKKYMSHFNSNKVADYIISKTFDVNYKNKFYWEK